jgi:queuosine precursor transporter
LTYSHDNKVFRWLTPVTGLFITSLIISNIIAVKLVTIFGLILPAAVVFFPITYIIGDVLTEVYGYARARQGIWLGFICNLIAVLAIWVAGLLPPALFWNAGTYASPDDAVKAYHAILGFTPRLLVASFIAYLTGEFLNSFVMAKLKLRTKGRFLWVRTIGSTIIGQAADSTIFISIAFVGIISGPSLAVTILSQWFFKVAYEALATPLTYLVVNKLKKVEGVDFYDKDTNFNPLKIIRYN